MTNAGDSAQELKVKPVGISPPGITDSDLWFEVGREFDSGITDTAKKFETTSEYLLALLIVESLNDSAPLFPVPTQPPNFAKFRRGADLAKRHWADFLAIIIAASLGAGLVLRSFRMAWPNKVPQVVVKSAGGIPAFHSIAADEVEVIQTPAEVGSLGSVDKVIGRYSLARIAHGAVIRDSQILTNEQTLNELKCRSVVRLPTKATSLESVKAGAHVTLMLSGQQDAREDSCLVRDVVLLGVEKGAESNVLVLAVTNDQLECMRGLLGRAEVFVVQ